MNESNIILSLDKYTIYNNGNYYLCVPNEYTNFYHVFMGFSDKDLTTLSHEELIIEIRKISDSINAVYNNGVYVLPIIPHNLFNEATKENDDRLYNKILNKYIQPITFEVYTIFTTQNVSISQIIKMIKQNDLDTKLIGWLSLKLGNRYIKEILFDKNNEDQEAPNLQIETIKHKSSSIFLDYQKETKKDKNNEDYISETLKPAYSPGFGSLGFIIMIITICIILGSAIAYMIIK